MADLLWIRAGTAFEKTEWGRIKLLLESAAQLQPKFVTFWEMAHFHMAYDAATAVNPKLPDQAKRSDNRAKRSVTKPNANTSISENQFLLDGIAFNPDSSRLYERLGTLYSKKLFELRTGLRSLHGRRPKTGRHGICPAFRRFRTGRGAAADGRLTPNYRALYDEGDSQRVPLFASPAAARRKIGCSRLGARNARS